MGQTLAERAAHADETIARGRAMLRDVIVEAAREGLTQREIAALVGRSQPEVGRHLAAARRTFAAAPQLAQALADLIASGRQRDALRVLLDGVDRLEGLSSAGDRAAYFARPGTTGDRRWDTFLAGCVAYQARTSGVVAPRWAWSAEPLESFWWPAGERAGRARTMMRTPVELKRLGIWFDERNFESA